MKQLILPLYEHLDQDYAQWSVTASYYDIGLHTLKDGSSYIRLIGATQLYLSPQDTIGIKSKLVDTDQQKSVSVPTTGISEQTLLHALAIAQDPELAVKLFALQKS